MLRVASIVAATMAIGLLSLAAAALAAPTTLNQGFTVSLRASSDSTVNHIVVTYGTLKSNQSGGGPVWGHYISDTAGINNITNPEEGCLTEDASHDFCPDGTAGGEPGAGSDIVANLRGGEDTFTATTSIGSFEVKGGDDDDVLRGSGAATHSPALGSLAETDYSSDYLYGQAGDDHVVGDLGSDFLNGGGGDDVIDGGPKAADDRSPTDDSIDGGPGNDLILAAEHDRDNLIDCGPGKRDIAVVDRVDPRPKGCEKVRVKR